MRNIGTDVTSYANPLGYTGKPVIVNDGRVISHGNQCWSLFCEKLRKQHQRFEPNQANTQSGNK